MWNSQNTKSISKPEKRNITIICILFMYIMDILVPDTSLIYIGTNVVTIFLQYVNKKYKCWLLQTRKSKNGYICSCGDVVKSG